VAESSAIEKLSGFFILQWGWKRAMLAFAAGGISSLAMAPFDLFWLLFATFPVLVWLIDGTAADPGPSFFARLKPSFITGWWFAFGYFLAGLWWVGAALLVEADTFAWMVPFAVLGLPAFLALYWAIAIAIARIFWSDDWRRIVILAACLGLAEYLRATLFTGFPWNSVGYAALSNEIMMQSVSVLGIYGITPLAILVFATPAIFAPGSGQKPRRMRALLLVSLSLVVAHVGFGIWRLQQNPTEFVEGVKLRLVQPAILQEEKWLPEKESEIFNSYISLSDAANGDITHFIWPESAFPFILTQRRDALAAIGNMLPKDSYLITGAMRVEAGTQGKSEFRVFNSVYVINDEGEITGAADKLHLVPFGEYLPFQELAERIGLQQLTGIDGGFTPASKREILSTKTAGSFLPLICYEITFPGQIRPKNSSEKPPSTSPGWIVNVTNDGWFGNTPGPYQHQRQAVIRGVEEGLPVVRAANSGISSVSGPYGRNFGLLPLGKRGKLDAKLPLPAATTYFTLYGNIGFFLISAGLLLLSVRRRTC